MRVRLIHRVLPLVVAAFAGAGVATAATATHASGGTVRAVDNSTYGKVLVAANGKTLYRYTLDRKGKSVCSGACAAYWPPLLVKGRAKVTAGPGASLGLLGTIKRAGGARQVTYAGFPLYFYAGDAKSGDAKGEGIDSTWYAVDARGALVKHGVSSATTTTTTPATTTTPSYGGGGGY